MSKHDARDVAIWFLAHNRVKNAENGDSELLTNLKLQKLLYYAQGAFLAITGEALFDNKIKAWMHGPVVPEVYNKYKNYGAAGIIFNEDFDFSLFEKEEALLCEVYDTFGQYSAWKLREMTHQETPWKQTPTLEEIPLNLIKDYFVENYIE